LIADDALDKRVRVSHTAKYVAERVNLVRYLNSLVFLYVILENPEHDMTLNRIETHPVENRFGLARMQCRGKNIYICFRSAFIHSQVLSTTLRNCGLNSSVRWDFSMGGSRLEDSDETLGAMFNPAGLAYSFHSLLAQEEAPPNLSAALSAIDP
jgi:hypothetical protein